VTGFVSGGDAASFFRNEENAAESVFSNVTPS
jgi:hypothetical protein